MAIFSQKIDVWFSRELYIAFAIWRWERSKRVFGDPTANRIIHLLKDPYGPRGGPVDSPSVIAIPGPIVLIADTVIRP